MTVAMSGKYLAWCSHGMSFADTHAEAEKLIEKWSTEPNRPAKLGVAELSAGALKIWKTPGQKFIEDCPIHDGKIYSFPEARKLIVAGKLPANVWDSSVQNFSHRSAGR